MTITRVWSINGTTGRQEVACSGTRQQASTEELNAAVAALNSEMDARDLLPTGAIAQTFPRVPNIPQALSVLLSGRLNLTAIYLPAGPVSSATFISGSTPGAALTHQWFALFDITTRALLGQTVNDGATAWAANAAKTLAFSTPVEIEEPTLAFLGINVTAGTVPTLSGSGGGGALAPTSVPLVFNGYSTSGLTGTAPDPAAAPTAFQNTPYAYVS